MNKARFSLILILVPFCFGLWLFPSCTAVDIFEKNVSIPHQAWSSQFKPAISFEIMDTTVRYNIYLVIRHTDAYRYKNIWISVHTQGPSGEARNLPVDFQLATDDRGWLGSGMDDIYEQRIKINQDQALSLHGGTWQFTMANIMRDDPLEHVLDIGIRLEKVPYQ